MDDKERFQQGTEVRKQVLGVAHVDRATRGATPFTQPFQEFITRYAWGEIWSRPGLDRHTRSLLTLALTIALNREAEFKLHVTAAVNNGVSPAEMQELILHAAIYCGLPAANNAFHWAESVLNDIDANNGNAKEEV